MFLVLDKIAVISNVQGNLAGYGCPYINHSFTVDGVVNSSLCLGIEQQVKWQTSA